MKITLIKLSLNIEGDNANNDELIDDLSRIRI
jgi:hypothetical protein